MAQHMVQQNAEGSRDLSTLVDASAELQHLVQTIWRLRQPDGCPWDREQTHQSIGKNMIEEAYEALDCIEADDAAHLREELGDVLMQVVLHAQIAADAGEFTLADVARDIDAKLIRRHPHVFGDADADNSDEVLKIWDEVKLAEKAAKDKAVAAGEAAPEGLLDGVPTHLPALMQAQKVSRKAAAVGFEWETVQDVWDEVAEERAEFEAEAPGSSEREMEFGDLLFALVNVARKEGIDAESALRASTAKFRRRWAAMEQMAANAHVDLAELSTHGLNDLWECRKGGGVKLRERRADTPHRSAKFSKTVYPSANLGHNAKSATWLTYGGAPTVHGQPVAKHSTRFQVRGRQHERYFGRLRSRGARQPRQPHRRGRGRARGRQLRPRDGAFGRFDRRL